MPSLKRCENHFSIKNFRRCGYEVLRFLLRLYSKWLLDQFKRQEFTLVQISSGSLWSMCCPPIYGNREGDSYSHLRGVSLRCS